MALTRRQVPKDPPEAIRARERFAPVDRTIVKAPTEFKKQYDVRWVRDTPMRLAEARAQGWEPISRKGYPKVACPYAVGNATDDFWHNVDTVLCMRPAEVAEEMRRDRQYLSANYLESQRQTLVESAGRMGMKNPDKNITAEMIEGSEEVKLPSRSE